MSVLLRVVGVETTGLAPPHEVIEIGVSDLMMDVDTKAVDICGPTSTLYRPTIPIPPEARAVHHITARDLHGPGGACMPEDIAKVVTDEAPFAMVAHNAAMERQWFTEEVTGKVHWICTLKAAKRLWPDAPAYGLQVLRYWLEGQDGLPEDFDVKLANQAHRAGPDTYVTAHLLAAMLKETTVKQLVIWTLMPLFYGACPTGKFRGKPWDEVDMGFLRWMLEPARDFDADLKLAVQDEITRRQGARR